MSGVNQGDGAMDAELTEDDLRTTGSLLSALGKGGFKLATLKLIFLDGRVLKEGACRVLSPAGLALGRQPNHPEANLKVADGRASRHHAEVVYQSSSNSFQIVDQNSRNGMAVNGLRVSKHSLQHGDVVRVGDALMIYEDAEIPEGAAVPDPEPQYALRRQVAEAVADMAAPSDLPMLITGPSGAGKEVMARRIHEKSGRPGDFVAINCATFSRELIASELFGHRAGAFSGAQSDRKGLFQSADGGTLLLDEIAELPLEQQAALLRVLQEGKVRPVGSDKETQVNVRVLAATHQSLDRMEQEGRFREDLHARLSGFAVELPPLNQRRGDILGLFQLFLGDESIRLNADAAELLLLYAWPKNVRELQHAARRAQLFAQQTGQVEVSALPKNILEHVAQLADSSQDLWQHLSDNEVPSQEMMEQILREHEGNVAQISRATGKHRQQIYRWMKKYGLSIEDFRGTK